MNACGSFGAPLIALLIALAPASEACAHASLGKAAPADGAVMPVPPATLALTFNEPVSPLVVRLIGPDGAALAPIAVTAQDPTITISPTTDLRRSTHMLRPRSRPPSRSLWPCSAAWQNPQARRVLRRSSA